MRVPSSMLQSGPLTITPYNGQAAKGKVYGTPVTVRRSRVESKRKMVRLPGGQSVVGTAVAIVQPNVVVKPEDKVSHRGREFEVYEVNNGEGLSSPMFLELVLGGPR